MKFDVEEQLNAVERSVALLERDGQPAATVTLAQSYPTTLHDLWDALTSSSRIPKWFLPISGDLKLGGHYQFQGNAGGTIVRCERPSLLEVTWEFGDQISWLEVHLVAEGESNARFKLLHTALITDHWHQFGPGAFGVGWEGGLLGLATHILRPDEPKADEQTFHLTPEGKALHIGSSERWCEAAIAAGEEPAQARAAANRTTAFYTGVPEGSE
ncbi:MAG: polyketide cyclase [Gammaproteobacteria bacterium]|nr:polyketide cyclase [Gammaproteobacteria bacterium]